MWYVIQEETGLVMVKCNYEPDAADLASRGEVTVESNEDKPLYDAEGNQLVAVYYEGWAI